MKPAGIEPDASLDGERRRRFAFRPTGWSLPGSNRMRAWMASDVAGSPSGRLDGACRDRTGDLLVANQALSQLS
jgi:hypothetical protein